MGQLPHTLPWYFALVMALGWVAVLVGAIVMVHWRRSVRLSRRVEVVSRRRPPDDNEMLQLGP